MVQIHFLFIIMISRSIIVGSMLRALIMSKTRAHLPLRLDFKTRSRWDFCNGNYQRAVAGFGAVITFRIVRGLTLSGVCNHLVGRIEGTGAKRNPSSWGFFGLILHYLWRMWRWMFATSVSFDVSSRASRLHSAWSMPELGRIPGTHIQ